MSITHSISTPRMTLDSLVSTLKDGQIGFREASENVKDTDLKELFSKRSLQRSKFAGELEVALRELGEKDPQDNKTSLSGALHRAWIDLKAAVSKHDRYAVLAEAERGEDVAVSAYRDALEREDWSASLRSVIEKQAAEVQASHDEVKALRDASAKK